MGDLQLPIGPSLAAIHGSVISPSSSLSRPCCFVVSPLCIFSTGLRNSRKFLVVSFKRTPLRLFPPRSSARVNMHFENGPRNQQSMETCFFWHSRMTSESHIKNSKRNARVLNFAQELLKDIFMRWSICCKTFQLQPLYSGILRHSVKLVPSLQQHSKTGCVLLTSIMAAILLMIGAPVNSPTSTWALTEENLIFLEAWRTIDRAYIDKSFNGQTWFRYREEALKREPMTNRDETYAAIRKMLATLGDPFTRFLEPEKFNSLRSGTRGAVTGIGVEVGFNMNDSSETSLVVISPVIGGPADRAGIVPGDIITEIDGVPTKGMGLYDAALRLQGPESSEVKLTVQKLGSDSPNIIMLMREKISINPVSWQLCEVADKGRTPMKIGYIRLASFNENASRSIKDAIQTLKEGGATAFILDMRNNSGGLFPACIEIAKMWLGKGVIVYIADSMGIRDIYEADGIGAISTDEPLAVLVNKGTASASEILAGALKDNKRAMILGEPTFGKGKIQSVFELSDGSGMAVTVARYQTPAHIDIDKVGITPDRMLPAFIPLDKDEFCECLVNPSLPCHMASSDIFSTQIVKPS